jgi:TonB-dependent SusC/RagA subfamily outer membrane receptor
MKNPKLYEKLIKAMKITIAQMFLAICFISISYAYTASAQSDLNQKIYLQVQDESLSKVLKQIEKQTKIRFVFSSKMIQSNQKVNAIFKGEPLSAVLDNLLPPRQLQYKVVDKVIILKKIEDSKTSITEPLSRQDIEAVTNVIAFPITGTVTDEKGEPIVGAAVQVKGTNNGTITDEKGQFKLNVADLNTVLAISFVGYERYETNIGKQTVFNIVLVGTGVLDEVVVVGYGTKKKANLTAAVSSIDAQAIENRPVENATLALQGLSPGLTVTRVSGKPGTDDINIQIRGATTANGNVEPLVVLDGVNVPTSTLTTMNPNDIENISVLKDAAAASIYGAQAAGGVILITSKKAKAGKVKFNYLFQRGAETSINEPDRLTLLEEAEFANLSQKNAGSGAEYSAADLQRIRDNIPYIVNPADTTQ